MTPVLVALVPWVNSTNKGPSHTPDIEYHRGRRFAQMAASSKMRQPDRTKKGSQVFETFFETIPLKKGGSRRMLP